jgi:pro-apoptotic serine protease NMA111
MSEYVKDPSVPAGWKVLAYPKKDEAADASNLTADAMDEGTEGGGSDAEPDQE